MSFEFTTQFHDVAPSTLSLPNRAVANLLWYFVLAQNNLTVAKAISKELYQLNQHWSPQFKRSCYFRETHSLNRHKATKSNHNKKSSPSQRFTIHCHALSLQHFFFLDQQHTVWVSSSVLFYTQQHPLHIQPKSSINLSRSKLYHTQLRERLGLHLLFQSLAHIKSLLFMDQTKRWLLQPLQQPERDQYKTSNLEIA